MDTIGHRLDELMQAHSIYRGRGQSALARNTGVPQPTINRILGDKSIPEMATVVKLAEAFDVTCEWLLTGRGPKYVAGIGGSAHPVSNPHSGIPSENDQQIFPEDVSRALQSVLTAFRAGNDIRNADVRIVISYALTRVESGNITRSSEAPATDHEQAIVDRAIEAIQRAGGEHVERGKGTTKKRH